MRELSAVSRQETSSSDGSILMKSYVFSVVIEADNFEDGSEAFHAYCPALTGCHTWGHTREEALMNIQDAVEPYIDDLRDA